MVLFIILMVFSSMSYASFNSPVSGSSHDSEVIAEAVSQLFDEDNSYTRNNIRRHAIRLVEEDTSSPVRNNDHRQSSFSLDNDEDRHYAHNIAIRASQMVMSDLQDRADRKMSKKQTVAISAASSLLSSVVVLIVTLVSKE